jgi:hypothetical protein
MGISYQTAWRHYKAGKIPYPTKQLASGTVIVNYNPNASQDVVNKAAIYAYCIVGRKVIPNLFDCLQSIILRDRGCLVVHPRRITPLFCRVNDKNGVA